jgi:hypothetical protein
MAFIAGAQKGITERTKEVVEDMTFNELDIHKYLGKQVKAEIDALTDNKPTGWEELVSMREDQAAIYAELFKVEENIIHRDFTAALESIANEINKELQLNMMETKLEDLELKAFHGGEED